MTANVVSLEEIEEANRVGDEPIERDTCIPIIDADPKKVAIVLRPKSWEKRRQWFDSIVADSLTKTAKMAEIFAERSNGEITERETMEVVHLGIHEAIARIIQCLGEEEPSCTESAAVFLCSANPDHFHAAGKYFVELGRESAARPPFLDQDVFPDGNALVAFLRISVVMRPGLAEYWRRQGEG